MRVRLVFLIFLLAVAGVAQAQGGPVDFNIRITGPQEVLDALHYQASLQKAMSSPDMAVMVSPALGKRLVFGYSGEVTPVVNPELGFVEYLAIMGRDPRNLAGVKTLPPIIFLGGAYFTNCVRKPPFEKRGLRAICAQAIDGTGV